MRTLALQSSGCKAFVRTSLENAGGSSGFLQANNVSLLLAPLVGKTQGTVRTRGWLQPWVTGSKCKNVGADASEGNLMPRGGFFRGGRALDLQKTRLNLPYAIRGAWWKAPMQSVRCIQHPSPIEIWTLGQLGKGSHLQGSNGLLSVEAVFGDCIS